MSAPATLAARFGDAKLKAERLVHDEGRDASVARVFTLAGPRLPLGGQFALGQFLGDALAGRDIRVTGDGSPIRTYLYAADLITWCLAILVRGGRGTTYNVGSERERTIGEVADLVARLRTPRVPVARGASGSALDRYVPDTSRARTALGVEEVTGFEEGLARTWSWLRSASR